MVPLRHEKVAANGCPASNHTQPVSKTIYAFKFGIPIIMKSLIKGERPVSAPLNIDRISFRDVRKLNDQDD